MKEELEAHRANHTYDLVPLPPGRVAIGSRWLYKIKQRANSTIDRVRQPEGFVDPARPHYVCLLHKSLYGLKQAPFEWHATMDKHLHNIHFKLSEVDPCLYIQLSNGHKAFIRLHMDNCTIIAHHSQIKDIKRDITAQFPINNLREATSVLRLKVIHNHTNSHTYVLQQGKINSILSAFNLKNTQPVDTPMTPDLQLIKRVSTDPSTAAFEYHKAIRMLLYLAHSSRPDILYTTTNLWPDER